MGAKRGARDRRKRQFSNAFSRVRRRKHRIPLAGQIGDVQTPSNRQRSVAANGGNAGLIPESNRQYPWIERGVRREPGFFLPPKTRRFIMTRLFFFKDGSVAFWSLADLLRGDFSNRNMVE